MSVKEMERYSLSTKLTGGEGIAWHIRGIVDGDFYGELRYDMPAIKRFNCKVIKGTFDADDWKSIVLLIAKLRTENTTCENAKYWARLVARETEAPQKWVRTIAGYSPGDEFTSDAGKHFKQLLTILEGYLKPYYGDLIPSEDDC